MICLCLNHCFFLLCGLIVEERGSPALVCLVWICLADSLLAESLLAAVN